MSSPDITEAERHAVASVLRTPNLSMGSEIDAFEAVVREFTGLRHAIGVQSGTAGLHLCVRAAHIQAGDLVITTPFSFVASTNVLLYEGANPVFVDVEVRSGNIDVEMVQQAVEDLHHGGKAAQKWLPPNLKNPTGALKALLPVHVFGQPADMQPLVDLAHRFGLNIIEDACEALGAEYRQRKAGTLGDYGVYAFYPNKQITTGEGGMIVTQDDRAAELMRALRNQGRAPGDTWLQHTYLGYNYRLDEMSAALGRVQMQRLDDLLNKRQRVAEWYNQRLSLIPEIETPFIAPTTTRMSWFVYVVRLELSIDRHQFAQKLEDKGIPVRPYFIPIHLQPYIQERLGYRQGAFPITEDLGRRGLALPFSSVMTEAQVEQVCQAIRDCL